MTSISKVDQLEEGNQHLRGPPPSKKKLKELQKSIKLVLLTYTYGEGGIRLFFFLNVASQLVFFRRLYDKSSKKPLQYSNLSPFSGYHPHTHMTVCYPVFNAILVPVHEREPSRYPSQSNFESTSSGRRYISYSQSIFIYVYINIRATSCPTPPSAPTLLLTCSTCSLSLRLHSFQTNEPSQPCVVFVFCFFFKGGFKELRDHPPPRLILSPLFACYCPSFAHAI